MKATLGVLMIIACIAFGLYVGLWWAFIGGIVDLIHAIRALELVAMDITIGVVKIMFAGVISMVSGVVISVFMEKCF